MLRSMSFGLRFFASKKKIALSNMLTTEQVKKIEGLLLNKDLSSSLKVKHFPKNEEIEYDGDVRIID